MFAYIHVLNEKNRIVAQKVDRSYKKYYTHPGGKIMKNFFYYLKTYFGKSVHALNERNPIVLNKLTKK